MKKEMIAELVTQAQSGDEQAMSRLLELAHGSVIFQCRKIMAHPEDAEDMTQEVLLKIYEKLNSLQEPEKFLSWANAIAARLCINDRQRHPKDLQFAQDEEGHTLLDNLEDLDQQNAPDAAIDNAETRRMIVELIDNLPEVQRTCTYLYYYDELSVKEIASLLQVSDNTVKSRLNYARKAIKDGVLDYEKKGVKLYGLSPLPFLLYFLHNAAAQSANPAAAAAAAKAVLAANGAAGAAVGAASAGTAGAAGVNTVMAAGGAAAKTAVGFFSSTAVKIAAGVLAGSIAVGGVAVGVTGTRNRRDDRQKPAHSISADTEAPPPAKPEPPAEPEPDAPIDVPTAPPAEAQPHDPTTPVTPAPYTTRRTSISDDIYLETPQFEEVNDGYRNINRYFDRLHAAFSPEGNHNIAVTQDFVQANHYGYYNNVFHVIYQDGYYLSGTLSQHALYGIDIQEPEFLGHTFDVRTGKTLRLIDLAGCTEEELIELIAEAIRGSDFGNLLNEANYPRGEHDFYILDGSVYYRWQIDETIDSQAILLPIDLSGSEK